MQAHEVAYTICVKGTYTGPLAPLRDYATFRLQPGQSRTFDYNHQIVQSHSAGLEEEGEQDSKTVVISNGYRTRESDNVRYARRGTYSAAVNDYINERDVQKLRLKYNTTDEGPARDIILKATGYDVLAPPPEGQHGPQRWTREGLSKMLVSQLTDLARLLPPTRSIPKDKDALVDYIAQHHPQLERNQARQRKQQAQPADLHNLYDQIGLDTSEKADVIANYNSHKGYVDATTRTCTSTSVLVDTGRMPRCWPCLCCTLSCSTHGPHMRSTSSPLLACSSRGLPSRS